MQISLDKVSKILRGNDCFYILTHQYPDGDTLGSAFALCYALQKIGKYAKVLCSDDIPDKFSFLYKKIKQQEFRPNYIISVDVADTQLLGEGLSDYSEKINLCIDHHGSNRKYADNYLVEPSAAATAEIIHDIIKNMGICFDVEIANCIYTGVSTDTGCFKYSNATPKTYRIAADMIEVGIDAARINRLMFDTKSRSRLEIERKVLDTLEFFFDNRCAVIYLTNEMIARVGAKEGDIDGLASIPRQVEGVKVGVTLREKESGVFKISIRTNGDIDASKLCSKFGGGGHIAAAGCTIGGGLQQAKSQIVDAIGTVLSSNL